MNTSLSWNPSVFSQKWNRDRSFGLIILAALTAFEIFNYGTTEFALSDLMGDLRFGSIRWATILALAFCGMDFAGLARLFTGNGNRIKDGQSWYLFGAWLLAAAMNAILTWWGVTIALLNHETLGSALVSRRDLLQFAPVFVAAMVWLIRVLMIGAFSMHGFPHGARKSESTPSFSPGVDRRDRSAYTVRRVTPTTAVHRSVQEALQTGRNGSRKTTDKRDPVYTEIPH